ncbi:hypothetical protein HL667_21210 [Bradyrhizobium sp. 83012]|uniref:Uncharacterized protein n=2 Tax=Bradyrhizobium aeschynomenes TaxID=2734909 RepID=A0ABX2CH46_9BRAD|nr:hypothetical protein [Bradyrhizobium aeschynomenes]NPU67536.1 hypothetical protein [Bradyrhizobium aeschynomenes]NPV22862.1 hypothetical protein [Bradyrhizobium aeschynomenes]
MTNPVLAALAAARGQRAPLFARWCERERETFLPASPAAVARFARDHAGLGVEKLWEAVLDVSRAHVALGFADPTAAAPVALAVDEIANLPPPRSWPDPWKARFKALPHDLKTFIAGHESMRERSLRRTQHALAHANRSLAHLQSARSATTEVEIDETES